MKLYLLLLIVICSPVRLYAREFADGYACRKGDAAACLRMALREFPRNDSTRILTEIVAKNDTAATNGQMKARLIAAAILHGNTIKLAGFRETLQLGCDKESDPLMCFGASVTLSRPGNTRAERIASKIWIRKSVALLEKDCQRGDGFACFLEAYFRPLAVDNADAENHLSLITKACELKEPAACLAFGNDKLAKGDDEGLKYLSLACEANYSKACFALSVYLDRKGKSADAISLAKEKCKAEVPEACSVGAVLIQKADSTSQDIGPLMIQACDLRDYDACDDYGYKSLKDGNTSQARTYFGRACDGDQSDGCLQKGLVENSLGNKKQASKLFEEACNKLSASGCMQLGLAKITVGSNKNRSFEAARPFFTKAHKILNEECNDGSNDSCERLKSLVQVQEKFGMPLDQ